MVENILALPTGRYDNPHPSFRLKREKPKRSDLPARKNDFESIAGHSPENEEGQWLDKVLTDKTARLANSIVKLSSHQRQRLSFSLETFLAEELKSIVQYALDVSPEAPPGDHPHVPTDRNPDPFLQEITRLINSNMDKETFNVNIICKAMCMSRTSLYNCIKKKTGKSIGNFIRTTRLKKAASLLMTDHLNVTEVMFHVGITSPSYFTRFFKKEFGIPPSQYAKRAQAANIPDRCDPARFSGFL